MAASPDQQTLAEVLPGTWSIVATNFPMWLAGDKRDPKFSYEVLSADPLVLSDDVSYRVGEEHKHILGRDTWRGDGFVWHGRGLLRVMTSRWTVAGLGGDGTIAAIRFSKSLVTPAGVDVIVRDGAEHPEVRALVAHASEDFGLTPEDFASLTWLDSRDLPASEPEFPIAE